MSRQFVRTLQLAALSLTLGATALGFTASAQAQTTAAQASPLASLHPAAQTNRVAAQPNFSAQTQLSGHLPGWANAANQVTSQSADLSAPMQVSVLLARDPAVQAAFTQFLSAQTTPGSLYYHQWLTPAQVGELFGPTDSDLAAVTSWLNSQGLTVTVDPNKVLLHVKGTLTTVGNAFHVNFAYFNLESEQRLSATSEPSIPTALTPVINSIHGLSETHLVPQSHATARQLSGGASLASVHPQYTNTYNGTTTYYVTPADFAEIYDLNSVYTGGDTGSTIGSTTQHIAIIGRSRVVSSDISEYQQITGLANANVNTIIPTGATDPGVTGTSTDSGDQGEATLDVDRVIGTANGAQADLIVAASTATEDGIQIAANYNVTTQLDPIMTISFGDCEISGGSSGVQYWDSMFSTAASEGISVFVSSGDSGAPGCDVDYNKYPNPPPNVSPYNQLSINYICSSSHATCVGGTEFNDASSLSTYWSSTNNSTTEESAKSYIPEGGWNEPTTLNSSGATVYQTAASGGGASTFILKPTWQSGTGVPADGWRDVPDVAFSTADHDGYFACLAIGGGNCAANSFVDFSGTSAAAPGMAAITALLNTKAQKAEGNINALLYKVAASTPAAFHDVTVSTSGVSGCAVTTASMCNNSTPGANALTGGVAGYEVGTGYDEVTGLGSLDVAAFINAALNVATTSTTTNVVVTPTTGTTNEIITFTATLTPSSTTAGTPTGTITFYYTPSGGTQTEISAVTINNNTASDTFNFSATGNYTITATYSGDSNYSSSTGTSSLVINTAPTFSVSPASTTMSVLAGATAGNTVGLTVTSLNSFTGTVALTCAVTATTNTTAGATCSAASPVTLAANGTSSSLVTINTVPGSSGTFHAVITGTSGSITYLTTIAVTVTPPSFTITPSPSSLTLVSGATTGNTSTLTLASVNNFAGVVSLSCSTGVTGAGCSVSPSTVTLTAGGGGSATVTITSTAGLSGGVTATVTGTGATAGATLSYTTTGSVGITFNAPSFTLAASPTTLTFNSGASSGNTSTITVTSANGFAGSVVMACAISTTSGSPTYPATCTVTSPVTLTAGGTGTATLTIASTTPHAITTTHQAGLSAWGFRGGVFLATLLCLIPFRRRQGFRWLATFALLAAGLTAMSGCGGGSAVQSVPQGSTGSYSVVVTGTGSTNGFSTSATTTVTVTVN